MSELDDLAAAAQGGRPHERPMPAAAAVVDYRRPTTASRLTQWRAAELFRIGFFGGLGFMSSVVVFWIALSVLFFLLSFVGCALLGGAASRTPQPPRTPPAFPFGQ